MTESIADTTGKKKDDKKRLKFFKFQHFNPGSKKKGQFLDGEYLAPQSPTGAPLKFFPGDSVKNNFMQNMLQKN